MLADRRLEMARQFSERGDFEAAADLARQALDISPSWAAAKFYLGEVLMKAGNVDRAAAAFTEYLSGDPADRMGAVVKLALLGAMPVPGRLPDAYVRSLFDQYAPRFDHALVDRLHYRAPQLMRMAIDLVRPLTTLENIMDLGCGTGLSGEAFKDRACRLDGIDLSAAMLAEAARKNIYTSLEVADLRAFLPACGRRYDLALAADVLVYLGDLEDVFRDVRHILNPDGLFCFSVQAADGYAYRLGSDHRYAYSQPYLERVTGQSGFRLLHEKACVLRQDEGRDVNGLVYVIGKI